MKKLAAASGVVLYEGGSRIYIVRRPAAWTNTFLFVTALLAVILLANAVLQLFFLEKGSPKIGIMLALIGLFFAILFSILWRYRKRNNAIPINKLPAIAVLDLESNNLLDGHQRILVPINQAYLKRKMQVTSSSPELILQWKDASLSIVKGNPFSGGITIIEKILLSKGIQKKH